MKHQLHSLKLWSLRFLFSCWILALSACASLSSSPLHGFAFNAMKDSPGVLVLAYKYGTGSFQQINENEETTRRSGNPYASQMLTTGGFIPRGDTLYVKWKIEATGQVLEDTVDLKSRLPRDITNHDIYFQIKGPQLVVYLITPERRAANTPPVGPSKSDYLKTYVIYPGQPDFSK